MYVNPNDGPNNNFKKEKIVVKITHSIMEPQNSTEVFSSTSKCSNNTIFTLVYHCYIQGFPCMSTLLAVWKSLAASASGYQ